MVDLRAVVFSGFDIAGFDSTDASTTDTTTSADEHTETGSKAGDEPGTGGDAQAAQQDRTSPTVQSGTDIVPVAASDVADDFADDGAGQIEGSPAASSGEVSASATPSAAGAVACRRHVKTDQRDN